MTRLSGYFFCIILSYCIHFTPCMYHKVLYIVPGYIIGMALVVQHCTECGMNNEWMEDHAT